MAPKKRKAGESDDNNSSGDEKSAREVENVTASVADEDGSCSAQVNDSNSNVTTVNKDEERDSSVDNGGLTEDSSSAVRADTSDNDNVAANEQGSQDSVDTSSISKPEKKRFRLSGSEKTGTLLICGGTNWDLIGRRELPKNGVRKPMLKGL